MKIENHISQDGFAIPDDYNRDRCIECNSPLTDGMDRHTLLCGKCRHLLAGDANIFKSLKELEELEE